MNELMRQSLYEDEETKPKTGRIYKVAQADNYYAGRDNPKAFEYLKRNVDAEMQRHIMGLMQDKRAYYVKYNGHETKQRLDYYVPHTSLRGLTEYIFSYDVLLVNPADCKVDECWYYPFLGEHVVSFAGRHFRRSKHDYYICTYAPPDDDTRFHVYVEEMPSPKAGQFDIEVVQEVE